MILECVSDKVDVGWFRTKMQRANLTVGKKYTATLLSDASGDYTTTTPKFLVYDDNGEWTKYPTDNFKPVEQ